MVAVSLMLAGTMVAGPRMPPELQIGGTRNATGPGSGALATSHDATGAARAAEAKIAAAHAAADEKKRGFMPPS